MPYRLFGHFVSDHGIYLKGVAMRVLFICKKNESYGATGPGPKRSGLFNSTKLIVKGLKKVGIEAEVEIAVDNNCIDKLVTNFRPQIVVIEALWVVPDKFDVLKKLHPRVKWFVHLHSDIPFLAGEGIAMKWLHEYAERDLGIIANSLSAYKNLREQLCTRKLYCLPNVYSRILRAPIKQRRRGVVNVGCFGAIRPMKNQLIQAIAAIEFAKQKNLFLRFHINDSRVERGGESVLRNLEWLFAKTPHAMLVKHPWRGPGEFIKYLREEVDIGMQVSLSETFNIVTADYLAAGLPIVVSEEVDWVSWLSQAPVDSVEDIVDTMHFVFNKPLLVRWNQHLLRCYSDDALDDWKGFCEHVIRS